MGLCWSRIDSLASERVLTLLLTITSGADSVSCPVCLRPGATNGYVDGRDQLFVECARCGRYALDPFAVPELETAWNERRFLLTAGLRRASDSGHPATLTADTADEVAATVRPPATLQEGVDRALRLLASRASRYFDRVMLDPDIDYPLVVARDPKQLGEYLNFAMQMEYYENLRSRITLQGWKRIEEIQARHPDSRQAFVAMWFDQELTSAWAEGFKPGIEDSQYFKALRIDKKEHSNKIDDEIVAEIRRSGLLVADFTGNRGGVYFEAGLAQGLGIPVIWTCKRDHLNNVHFDTRQYNHIDWQTPAELRSRLDQRIRATLLPRESPG